MIPEGGKMVVRAVVTVVVVVVVVLAVQVEGGLRVEVWMVLLLPPEMGMVVMTIPPPKAATAPTKEATRFPEGTKWLPTQLMEGLAALPTTLPATVKAGQGLARLLFVQRTRMTNSKGRTRLAVPSMVRLT